MTNNDISTPMPIDRENLEFLVEEMASPQVSGQWATVTRDGDAIRIRDRAMWIEVLVPLSEIPTHLGAWLGQRDDDRLDLFEAVMDGRGFGSLNLSNDFLSFMMDRGTWKLLHEKQDGA